MEKHRGVLKIDDNLGVNIFTLTEVEVEIPWAVLSQFNIVDYLKSEKINVVENKDNTEDVRFVGRTLDDVRKIIKSFVGNNIYFALVQFQSTLAFKLLLLNDVLNTNVLDFLKCFCRKSGFPFVDIKSRMCYLYCNTQNELQNLKKKVECAIVEIVLTKSEMEQRNVYEFIEKWQNTFKLIPCGKRGFATKFVATCDVYDKFDKDAIYEQSVQMTVNEIELLTKCEELHKKLIDLSKSCFVTVVDVDKQANLLILKGTKKRLRQLMSNLRNLYIQIETSFHVPVSKVHLINDELQKLDDKFFSVDLTVYTQEQEVDDKVVASWLKSDGQGVYLVKADLLTLNVDVIVILSTTSLFPLFNSKETRAELLQTSNLQHCQIGKCIFSENAPLRCMIPVHDNNQRRNDLLWEDQLKQSFSLCLDTVLKKGLKTVAIHASVFDKTLAPHFLQTFIETSIEHHLKSYICCERYEEITPVHNIIQESLLLGSHVFRRNLHYNNVQGHHRIAVEIVTGSLVEQKADFLVNTVDASLNLKKGQLSKEFLHLAGKTIQDECNEFHPHGLSVGECTVTGAGLLEKNGVRKIVHCVLPDLKKHFEKDIKHMVKLCLMNADLKSSTSIAFPSLGMGNLGYPIPETQNAMLQAVEEYQYEAICSSLKTVIFVVYNERKEKESGMFKEFLKKRDALFPKHDAQINPELLNVGLNKLEVKISKVSIFDQQVQVLVNTADTSLDLQKGQLSKLFIEHGGQEIQTACSKLHPDGLMPRKCTVTKAGKLAKNGVRIIVHCVWPNFDKTQFEKDVKDMVKLCLMHADKKQCKSIAFPSIGMGKLGYPILETKYAMLQAVEEYRLEAVCSTLETVVFVVLEDDMFEQFEIIQRDVFHPKNKTNDLIKIGLPGICKIIDTVKICVTSNLVKTCFPLSTILFNVTTNGQGGEVDVQLSKGHIVSPSTTNYFTIENTVQMCVDAKVMDVLFNICEGTIDTVERIITAIQNLKKKGHLRIVFILVASQELLEKAQNYFCSWYNVLTDWTKAKDDIVQCSMRVLTLKQEAEDVLNKCQKIVSLGENKHDNRTDWNVDEGFEVVEYAQGHEENYELSAQINPGIVHYLQDTGGLETWLSTVKEAFGVFVKRQESSEFMVSGTVANVTLFEQYLLTEFPKPPLKRSNAIDTEGHGNYKTAVVPRQDKWIKNYDFGEFTVKVCQGDIADFSEDCIISPTHEYIKKTTGVAKRLFEKGGQKYKESCEKLEKYGPMSVTECRVSDPGYLTCQKVIHVCIPRFFAKVDTDGLNVLEEAILNCLETAGAYGLSTVAMPAVGTGSGLLKTTVSSYQISRAIHRYLKGKEKLVSHVTIVILQKETAQSFEIHTNCDDRVRTVPIFPVLAFDNWIQCHRPIISKTKIDAINMKTNKDDPLEIPAAEFFEKIDKTNCSPVVHVKFPVWNPKDYPDISQFETEICTKTKQLLQYVNAKQWDSVALSLSCENDNQESFQAPLRRICGAMIRGLRSVKDLKKLTSSLKLYLISSRQDYADIFFDLLKNEK